MELSYLWIGHTPMSTLWSIQLISNSPSKLTSLDMNIIPYRHLTPFQQGCQDKWRMYEFWSSKTDEIMEACNKIAASLDLVLHTEVPHVNLIRRIG